MVAAGAAPTTPDADKAAATNTSRKNMFLETIVNLLRRRCIAAFL
jgi:hypothetical protein